MVPATTQTSDLRAPTGDLTAPGAVLLVSCYELGHQPLNLAFPLAYLRGAGYAPVAVDTAVEPLDEATIAAARVVAISVPMHTALRLGTQVARRVRQVNPTAIVGFYGLYAWLNADYLLREHGDFVIGGEFERPLLDLLRALAAGQEGPVEGVSTRTHRAAPSLARIDFPTPDRAGLPSMKRYAHLMVDGMAIPAGYTETTRGCHHTCLHCPIVPVYRGRFFAIPREIVLEDIRRQVRAGARHITFGDPDFLNGPTHSLRICRAMHDEFPHVTFDMTTRIEHILQHRELMPEFAALGCLFVVSAVESVSETVLDRIDKGHTKADVVEALRILEDAGIAMRPSLLPFTPWTTLEDYLELLRFVEEYDLIDHIDPVHFSIRLLVPPGSALLDRPETAEWLGPLDEASFTYTWRSPDPRLDALQQEVARIAEAGEATGQDYEATFAQIKAAAYAAAGQAPPVVRRETGVRRRPPRLSESWFC
ncbi:MAG: CUAEP/CCAEP-tail radical SAM protein [Sphaerobacter sp.]|nr:CUAEP/CCAEP-tail radical SAM protein [Sphaerobacter sp.]